VERENPCLENQNAAVEKKVGGRNPEKKTHEEQQTTLEKRNII